MSRILIFKTLHPCLGSFIIDFDASDAQVTGADLKNAVLAAISSKGVTVSREGTQIVAAGRLLPDDDAKLAPMKLHELACLHLIIRR